jgi:hypothetical protein
LCAGGKAIRHSIEHNGERSQKPSSAETRTVSGSHAIPHHEKEKMRGADDDQGDFRTCSGILSTLIFFLTSFFRDCIHQVVAT